MASEKGDVKGSAALEADETASISQGRLDTIHNIDERVQHLAREAPPFYRNHNLLILYMLMVPGCIIPAVTLGFDSAMMNGLQSVPTWLSYFGNPEGSTLGILNAVLALGAICATPFISPVCDRWGRRMGIFVGAIIMLIGGVIQGASVHIAMFIISRFVIGSGLIFANACVPVLMGELAHPKDRMVVTSLYQTSWYIGAIIAAWTTFGTFRIDNNWAWRIPSYMQAGFAVIQIMGVWFLPESPRFLIAKGRTNEAKAVLTKYHANGDEESALVDLAFAEMRATIESEMTAMKGWKTLLQTPGNRRRMLLMVLLGLFSQWSGNGLVSYYLGKVLATVGVTSSNTQTIINGCLMIFNWITATTSAFLTAKLKRRTQFLISGFGMLAVFSAQTLCAGLFNEHGNQGAGYGVVAMLFVYYAFYNLGFNALVYSYPVEVLPYPIRAKGFSVLMFFGKVANFLNTFVNPIGLQAMSWKYYAVYVGWLCVECGCIWAFFVETKGPSLEAIATAFDGERVAVHVGQLKEVEDKTKE
ncbi:General substrate transporter [Pleurostoma richardsiae]|uniref:General substrate transporter n=1 Tax=Pleurostoma richardsiae TaxID=41990 RepID=A0AA38RRR0_9PEZI|nr:General substrate transporter [Pleurostoma richardsiae]